MHREYADRYPRDAQPFLTCTYRHEAEQGELVRTGKSRAKPGESLHNFRPALAFDVAFLRPDGGTTWEFHHFERWGELAEEIGLEWGGRWPFLVDGPHVQWPVTWQDARLGKLPELPPLPSGEEGLLPVRTLHVMRLDGTEQVVKLDETTPARVVGTKLYVNEADP